MREYDTAPDDFKGARGNGSNNYTPSREHAIEEVPIALGFLVVTGGDYEETIFGGTNYGRDNDSIAGMGGAIAGALHGIDALAACVGRDDQQRPTALNLMPMASDLADLARKLQAEQLAAAQGRQAAFDALSG